MICVLIIVFNFMVAADLDAPSQEALGQTQSVLRSPKERDAAFKENPKYKEAEGGANALVQGNEAQKQQMYEMAAQLMKTLAEKSGGDAAVMQEMMIRAQKDPAQFMREFMTESQKQQVRDLATDIEKQKGVRAPAPQK